VENLDKINADDLKPLNDLAQNVLAFVVAEAAVTDRGRSRCDRRIRSRDRAMSEVSVACIPQTHPTMLQVKIPCYATEIPCSSKYYPC
jgi:hypothetical protein